MRTAKRIHPSSVFPIGLAFALLAGVAGPIWATEGPELPPIPRTKSLNYYLGIVDAALPAFTPAMLSAPSGPDWMAGKTVHDVALAMQDSDPGTIVAHGSLIMGYDPPDGPRYIKLDFDEGYIRFTNRERSYHTGSPCTAVPMTEANAALGATAGALGIPTSEWDVRTVDTVMERSVTGEAQDPTPEVTCQTERMVTMTRKSPNAYPVFDSMVRESVSNLHERARLLVDWPRFMLQTGLNMRTRTDVVTDLAERMLAAESDDSGLGAEVDLEIRLGYARKSGGFVPVARAVFADIYDRYAGLILDVPLALNPSSIDPGSDVLATVRFGARVDATLGIAQMDFFLPRPETVRLTIADVTGRQVAVLAEGDYAVGWHQVSWNLQDGRGRRAPSGVYFARLEAGREAPIRKILVLR